MPRAISDATALRNAKSNLARCVEDFETMRLDRDIYRSRAAKAEGEAAVWKARFKILLRVMACLLTLGALIAALGKFDA